MLKKILHKNTIKDALKLLTVFVITIGIILLVSLFIEFELSKSFENQATSEQTQLFDNIIESYNDELDS